MPSTWRTVRVFISSTFRDMHAERDYLVGVVFPELRERLEGHRVHLIDIDLRWGVTRSQAENDQVLALCLEQIDECRPFFLSLLGERYGSVPTRFPADSLKRFGWVQHHAGKSLTELEVLHAALSGSEFGFREHRVTNWLLGIFHRARQKRQVHSRVFFYFRDPQALGAVPDAVRYEVYAESDPTSIARLADLKRRIRSSGYPLIDGYPARWDPNVFDRPSRSQGRLVGLEAFGERVRQQLWQAIREELRLADRVTPRADPDPLAEEQDYHERFMESRLRVYVGREQINDALLAFADGNDVVPCLVTGPSGSGKSAALARFVRDYQNKQTQTLVIPHFIGASPRSTNLRDMLRRFCQILKARFGFAEDVPEEVAKLSVTFRDFVGKVPADARPPGDRRPESVG